MGAISAAAHRFARTGLEPVQDITDTAPAATTALPPPPVLVITDLSKAGNNAAWRAALVARDRKLPLHILSLRTDRASASDTHSALDKLAHDLRERLLITVSAQVVRGDLLREGTRAAREAALLVIAPPRAQWLGDWLLGSRAERVARHARKPVLIVRRPAFTSYRNVIVPVALETATSSLIAAATAISRDPRMKVLHVLPSVHEEAMRLADVPERTIRSERQKAAKRARRALVELIDSAGAQENGAMPAICFGDAPSRVVEKERTTGAELMVLGQRPRRSLIDLLPGGVTRRVLRVSQADVLLVPLPRPGGLSSRAASGTPGRAPRLDPRSLPAPSVALTCAMREVARLADMVEVMLRGLLQVFLRDDDALGRSVRHMDEAVDDCHGQVKHYLAAVRRGRLSEDEERRWKESMAFSIALAQVANTVERVLRDLDRRAPAGKYSSVAIAEVCSLHTLLMHSLRLAVNLLLERNAGLAQSLSASDRAFVDLKQSYEAAHVERLSKGDASSVSASAVYLDLLGDLERMNTLVCSLAACFLPSRRITHD